MMHCFLCLNLWKDSRSHHCLMLPRWSNCRPRIPQLLRYIIYDCEMSMKNTFVIESVCDFVSDDDPDSAVVEGLGEVLVVERGLEDGSGEH